MRKKKREKQGFAWVSYSDLSTGLMLCFILLLIASVKPLQESLAKAKNRETKVSSKIDQELATREALGKVLKKIEVEMNTVNKKWCKGTKWQLLKDKQTLRIRFIASDSWFDENKAVLKKNGRRCLRAFAGLWTWGFYNQKKLIRKQIKELTVEGHANSTGKYLPNLKLSQRRAFNTSEFILKIMKRIKPNDKYYKFHKWLEKHMAANGKSDAVPVLMKSAGRKIEDKEASKRVEFKYSLKRNYKSYEEISRLYRSK